MHALAEGPEFLVQDLLLLLAHRLAEQVGLAQGVAGDLLGEPLHLLLVDDQAVRRPENLRAGLLQLGVDRRDLLLAVLAERVVGVGVGAHRAGPVERAGRGDVLEVVRAHQPQERAHPGTVHLEDAERVTAAEQVVRRLVVQWQLEQVDLLAAAHLDVANRVVHDGEVAQPEEVHLQQAERLAGRVVELRDHRAVGLALHQRHVVGQRLGRHDHPGCVHAGLADQALQALRGVDDLLDVVVLLIERPDLARLAVAGVGRVEDPGERDVLAHHRGRHRLGDLVAEGVRVTEDPGGVLDRGLRLDRAEGHDLGDLVLAVLLGDVADDLAPPALVEVDVDVGHRDALGVEEPLEQQPVLQRVDVGDAERVRHHAARRGATARADRDAVVLGPHDEVRDDQEVRREAHLQDDPELELHLLAVGLVVPVGEPAVHAPPGLLAQPRLLGVALRDVEPRHQVAELEHPCGVHPLRDRERGAAAGLPGLGAVQCPHLLRGLEVVAGPLELERRRGQRGRGLDAQQRGVCGRLVLVGVVGVVGDDVLQPELAGDLLQATSRALVDVDAVVHQLDEVVLPAEDVAEVGSSVQRLLLLAEADPGGDLPRRAAGGGHQALAVLGEQLPVDPGFAEEALHRGPGLQLEQVVQTDRVPRPDGHVRERTGAGDVVALLVLLAPADRRLVVAGGRGDVGLHTDDRRDPRRRRPRVEVVRPVQVSVVCDRDGRHLEPLGLGEHVLEFRRAVEHGVLGVDVQVDERVRHQGEAPPVCADAEGVGRRPGEGRRRFANK